MSQMARLVERYVPAERIPGQQGRLYLGAAILMQEAGLPDAARRYADKAVSVAPYLREQAARFVPAR